MNNEEEISEKEISKEAALMKAWMGVCAVEFPDNSRSKDKSLRQSDYLKRINRWLVFSAIPELKDK